MEYLPVPSLSVAALGALSLYMGQACSHPEMRSSQGIHNGSTAEARGVAQLVDCLPSLVSTENWHRALHKTRCCSHTSNLSTQEVEAEGSQVQNHPGPHKTQFQKKNVF